MKRLVLFVLLLAVSANAQFAGVFWGKKNNSKITIGSTFIATDSLRIQNTANQLSNATSTLYSEMLYIDNRSRGTGVLTISLDAVNSAMDSAATVWWRFYDDKDVHPKEYWDVWHRIGGYHQTDRLYIYELADSSWWRPARGGQVRFIKSDADNDTCTVNLGFYSN